MDPKVALEWINMACRVLTHMGCLPDQWVRVATKGQTCWESTHTAFLGTRALDQISWDEFREFFYSQYFSSSIREKKKMKFLSLRQKKHISIAEYQTRLFSCWRGSLQAALHQIESG